MDPDAWFGYTTKKTVFIQDRWLGFIYYSLVLCVLLYVFAFQILQDNEQFMLNNVQGIPRIKVTQPTKGLCDEAQADCKSAYRSLTELSYCTKYTGKNPEKNQATCKFLDATSIIPDGDVDNKIFIPTSIEIVTEKKSCKPGPDNGYTCDNEYEELPASDCLNGLSNCQTRGGLKDQFYYVADTKNFHVQFTSSYEEGDVHGTSLDHPAYYEMCPSRVKRAKETHLWADRLHHSEDSEDTCGPDEVEHVKMPCAAGVSCRQMRDFDLLHDIGVKKALDDVNKTIAGVKASELRALLARRKGPQFLDRSHGHLAADSHDIQEMDAAPIENAQNKMEKAWPSMTKPSVGVGKSHPDQQQWSNAYGDVFTLARLMELAGADLDNSFNPETWSTRESGTVLEVSVFYSNLHRWTSSFGYKDVNYHYRVKELPLPYVSRKHLAEVQPADFPETRRYEIQHGIMIWFRVVGEFGTFNKTYLLIYLVTAFALIGAASAATDFIAVYVHKRRNNYFNLKYEVSGDFSSKWQCPKCTYWNSSLHATCQQYDMWSNKEEAPRCGVQQPK